MPSFAQASLTLTFLLGLASQAVASPYDSDDLAVRDDFDDSAYMLARYDDSLFERDELAEYLETRGVYRKLPKKASQGSLAAKHARKGKIFGKKAPNVLMSKGPKRGGPFAAKKKTPGVLFSKGPIKPPKKGSTLFSKGPIKPPKKGSTLFSKGPIKPQKGSTLLSKGPIKPPKKGSTLLSKGPIKPPKKN